MDRPADVFFDLDPRCTGRRSIYIEIPESTALHADCPSASTMTQGLTDSAALHTSSHQFCSCSPWAVHLPWGFG